MMQKNWKMTETMANGYSSESTQRELSNEYQHDRVYMLFNNLRVLVLWMKVALALEGLSDGVHIQSNQQSEVTDREKSKAVFIGRWSLLPIRPDMKVFFFSLVKFVNL